MNSVPPTRRLVSALLIVGTALTGGGALAADTALYDASGVPVAYLADDATIYLWSGQPVAYLQPAGNEVFHLYRFGGKHMGWFAGGIVRDQTGDGACAVEGLIKSPTAEPAKPPRQTAPDRILRDLPPPRPAFSRAWAEASCLQLLRIW